MGEARRETFRNLSMIGRVEIRLCAALRESRGKTLSYERLQIASACDLITMIKIADVASQRSSYDGSLC